MNELHLIQNPANLNLHADTNDAYSVIKVEVDNAQFVYVDLDGTSIHMLYDTDLVKYVNREVIKKDKLFDYVEIENDKYLIVKNLMKDSFYEVIFLVQEYQSTKFDGYDKEALREALLDHISICSHFERNKILRSEHAVLDNRIGATMVKFEKATELVMYLSKFGDKYADMIETISEDFNPSIGGEGEREFIGTLEENISVIYRMV